MLRTLFFAIVLSLIHLTSLRADVKSVKMENDYCDFAFEPKSGLIAAVSMENDRVDLFRKKDIVEGNTKPLASIPVGKSPCSIIYKQYMAMSVFIVTCTNDKQMYVIDATTESAQDGSNFNLHEPIPLEGIGNTMLATSGNPRDPFVYFVTEYGRSDYTQVVSLRDLKSYGRIGQDAGVPFVSFDGRDIFYYHSSSSDLDYKKLTNAFTDASPRTDAQRSLKANWHEVTMDPRSQFVAVGKSIYSSNLASKESTLGFEAYCFLQSRAAIVGVKDLEKPQAANAARGSQRNLEICAASYNTFQSTGKPLRLEFSHTEGSRIIPQPNSMYQGVKPLEKRPRMFEHVDSQSIIYADGSTIHVIPIADLELPDEPVLLAKIDGADSIFCDQVNQLTVTTADPRIEIQWDRMPDGMTATDNTLTWKPTTAQVGMASLRLTLKHGDVKRKRSYELNVEYPNVMFPFVPQACTVDASLKTLAVWTGLYLDDGSTNSNPSSKNEQLALVDLKQMKITATRQLPEHIAGLFIGAKHVFFLPSKIGLSRVEVLDRKSLQRVTSLIVKSPITHFAVQGRLILVQTENEMEVFDATSLDRLKTFTNENRFRPSKDHCMISEFGFIAGGVLYDFEFKPTLLLKAEPFLEAYNSRPSIEQFYTRRMSIASQGEWMHRMRHYSKPHAALVSRVPGSNIELTLQEGDGEAGRNLSSNRRLTINATGAIQCKQVLREHSLNTSKPGSTFQRNIMFATQNTAYVLSDRQLFLWDIPTATDTTIASSPEPIDDGALTPPFEPTFAAPILVVTGLRIVPLQPSIALSDGSTTILDHGVIGNTKDVTFSLKASYPGVSIEESTGTITIDHEPFVNVSMERLAQQAKTLDYPKPPLEALEAYQTATIPIATQILGSKPQGVPIAVPIQIEATNAFKGKAELQYFILVTLANEPLKLAIERALEAERKHQDAIQAQIEMSASKKPKPQVPRTWSSKSGSFQIEATFLDATKDTVRVTRKDNGKTIVLKIDMLSQADHEFIEANRANEK